jgi:predicted AAA+ superfamily ATPase
MIPRRALAQVRAALTEFPVVALLGPRQVGKTTLARALTRRLGRRGTTYLDLEAPGDRARLADAEAYLEGQRGKLVILDEVHRTPAVFEVLRVLVDRRRRAGERTGLFLVLGSAGLDLLRQSSESLAGRIGFVDLTPVRLDELPTGRRAVDRLWLRGGFPDSFLARDDAASLRWRQAFIRTYLERDVPMLGPRIPAETLRRFWTMLAHTHGQTLNAARLAAALGVSGQTVARYLDLLVDLLLVRRLPPFAGNVGKRLVRSPKVYLRDSGVAHALLDLETLDDLLAHPVAGASWEGLVIEALIGAASGAPSSFYRTSAGAEIDLVIEGRRGRRLAIEVKRSLAPSVGQGLRSGCADLDVSAAAVVYPGTERFPLGDGIVAIGVRASAAWVRRELKKGTAARG